MALEVLSLTKHFGATQALRGASLEVQSSEIHGLVGENGSGKSTMVKILSGYHRPDAGTVRIWGEDVHFPVHPERHGLGIVHQDLGLVETVSVLENVAALTGFDADRVRPIPWRRLRREASELTAELGLSVALDEPAGNLTRAEQALVAIGRVLRQLRVRRGRQPALIVLDEPTASLTGGEAERVFDVLRGIARSGGAVVLISHKLEEVAEVCHRVTVIRDGETVATESASPLDVGRLMTLMLGAVPDRQAVERATFGSDRLQVRKLSRKFVRDLSFEVPAGGIVGITGLVGMGQDEVPYLIGGASAVSDGTVEVDGRSIAPLNIRNTQKAGLFVVPAEPRRQGLWVEATAAENLELPVEAHGWHRVWREPGVVIQRAKQLMSALQVRPLEPTRPMWAFSGGNQQKVLLAKWMQMEPAVLVLHEPTQGVDVGAKREIHSALQRLAASGRAVCICSSDHEELAELCDRVITLYEGQVSAVLTGKEVSLESIVAAANRRPPLPVEAS